MMTDEDEFETLKADIDRRFPVGQFVAVESDRVIADADSHHALVDALKAQGKSPRNLIIIQAGVDYPESAVILSGWSERAR